MVLKKDIRRQVLERRSSMSEEDWEEKSHIIAEKVAAHPFFLETDILYCYIDYKNEVGTRELIQKAWEAGKEIRAPKILDDEMEFYKINAFEELSEGYKGILEPVSSDKLMVESGLVIVPGVAFDRNRNRIGYGKGYYDRFLGRFSNLRSIAIAFELQVLDQIPAEVMDVRPDILITEEQTYVE